MAVGLMKTPWLEHYDAGIPRTLEYPETTLVDVLRVNARRDTAAVNLVFKGRKI